MSWKNELNSDFQNVENSTNDYLNEFKSQRRKRLIRWVIRQMYTGLFMYLFRDSKYFNVLLTIWIVFASINLFVTFFLGKIIHMRFQKISTKFNSSMNQTPETIDIEDVEVVDVETNDPKIKE
jgi:hypothetical protein